MESSLQKNNRACGMYCRYGGIDRHNFFFASLLMYIENVLFYIKRIYDTFKVGTVVKRIKLYNELIANVI